MNRRLTLYHGTAHVFDAFDPHYALRGTEPNSALGIHLTEQPSLAVDYARLACEDLHGGLPTVLIVEADIRRVALCTSSTDYLGRSAEDDFEATRQPSEFVEARLRLTEEGYDAVAADTGQADLEGCWAVFDPARLTIVGRLTLSEAEACEPTLPDGFTYESVRLFDGVENVLDANASD